MRWWNVVVAAALLCCGCGGKGAPAAADSSAAAQHLDDSIVALRTVQAPAFADTARSTLAALLSHPETASFDSVVVVQPPKQGDRWPTPVVCGRMGGRPGIGGRNTPTPFIYQNRVNVFVLDQNNGPAFATLRAKECDDPAARILLR